MKVNKLCCLFDMINVGDDEGSIVARIRCRWKKFRELLPLRYFQSIFTDEHLDMFTT